MSLGLTQLVSGGDIVVGRTSCLVNFCTLVHPQLHSRHKMKIGHPAFEPVNVIEIEHTSAIKVEGRLLSLYSRTKSTLVERGPRIILYAKKL